ncbi:MULTISPECIES: hypothetical protein [unclassified Bacillus (in: firmicutes)]|uniref:hypothetical protein n=1 Tax=unclassified Bacillus (in: firmicutes) TaxID=185979 RepID=UPI001BEA1DAF|nr:MULTISPECIES: hypothetical protein [unclassified Bacillus (in: firmicutes)]MBT2728123.1 hypothetical protein [Bacillus sp. ISL-75]MBT2734742.1 hypothetical protein [Bacillus sp. ISL-7]
MSIEIHKERRRIAYRLCGCFTPLEVIAYVTKLPLPDVIEIDNKRTSYYNQLIKQRMNFVTDVDKLFAKLELDDIEKEDGNEQGQN